MTHSRPHQDALWLARLQRRGAPLDDGPALRDAIAPGLALLRQGRYWEAHEALETPWLAAPYPHRLFPYALIKVAVGLLHLERGNAAAAERQLTQAAAYLQPFTPAYAGLDTGAVLSQVRERLNAPADGERPGAAVFTLPDAP